MTILIWALVIIGVAMILGSFFVTEKLSNSDIERIRKLSDDEIKIMMEKAMNNAQGIIADSIESETEKAMASIERNVDKETNENIMHIDEYSNTVLETMNKSHSEILFLYNMLGDKHESLTKLTKELQMLESAIAIDKKGLEKSLELAKAEEREAELDSALEFKKSDVAQDLALNTDEHMLTPEQKIANEMLPGSNDAYFGHNEEILTLYKGGRTPVEIARELGLGLGEIKLVLQLNRKEQTDEA